MNLLIAIYLMQDSDDDEEDQINDSSDLPADDREPATRSLSQPVNPAAAQKSSVASASVSSILSIPVRSSIELSKRATDIRRRMQLRGLMQQVPSTLPVRPSAVLNLGKSIALPTTKSTGMLLTCPEDFVLRLRISVVLARPFLFSNCIKNRL